MSNSNLAVSNGHQSKINQLGEILVLLSDIDYGVKNLNFGPTVVSDMRDKSLEIRKTILNRLVELTKEI